MSGGTELTLTILGCSGSYAGPGGACTGYLVRGGGEAVWLDAGPGTLAQLQHHVTLTELSALVLTHPHPDHWMEVPVLTNALRHYVARPRLPVVSNQAMRDRALAVVGAEPLDEVYDWAVVDMDDPDAEHAIGAQTWTFSRTDHYVPTMAVRAACGDRSLAFSADTGTGWSMSALAPVDLALIESTSLDRSGDDPADPVKHLCADEAGTMAARCGADHLVLTHLAPGEDPEAHRASAATTFDGRISVAAIGDVYAA